MKTKTETTGRPRCRSCGHPLQIRQTQFGREYWYCGHDECLSYGAQDWVGAPVHGRDYLVGRPW